jgi:hypothetical protein
MQEEGRAKFLVMVEEIKQMVRDLWYGSMYSIQPFLIPFQRRCGIVPGCLWHRCQSPLSMVINQCITQWLPFYRPCTIISILAFSAVCDILFNQVIPSVGVWKLGCY